MSEQSVFQKIIERERSARKAAEELLENKSLELFLVNQSLSQLAEDLDQQVMERTAHLEQAKNEALEANRVKDQFLANMSHELQTPINIITGFIEMMLSGNPSEQERIQLTKMKGASDMLLTLISDILNFSEHASNKIEFKNSLFSIRNLLDRILNKHMVASQARENVLTVSIGNDIDDQINSDESRLEQVIDHLVENAIKFTRTGTIEIGVGRTEDPQFPIRLFVKDSGVGIDAKFIPHLFKPFSQSDSSDTRNHGGLGLGLSLCKEIVNGLKGKIQVKSESGIGSEFSVLLPRNIVKINSEIKPLKVLLVEDAPLNREVARAFLESLGHQVVEVDNGQVAVNYLQRGETVDVILMDCQMPVMDGFEATERIKQLFNEKTPPIFAVSASMIPETRERCMDLGMTTCIAKPVNWEHLKQELAKITPMPKAA